MILESMIAGLGILLTLFVPGFVLSLLILKNLRPIERFIVGFGLSVAILFVVAVILGTGAFGISGGFSALNVWVSLAVISLVLLVIYKFQR